MEQGEKDRILKEEMYRAKIRPIVNAEGPDWLKELYFETEAELDEIKHADWVHEAAEEKEFLLKGIFHEMNDIKRAKEFQRHPQSYNLAIEKYQVKLDAARDERMDARRKLKQINNAYVEFLEKQKEKIEEKLGLKKL